MYAVIKTGGKQYRVQPGDLLVVEKLDGDVGAELSFDQVLMLGGDAGEISIGAPVIEGALVRATLVETRKGEKVKVFKKIRRQGYKRTKGHRQQETVVRVTGLTVGGKETKWDGTVDMTTKAELNLRARNLAKLVKTTEAAPAAVEATPVVTKGSKASAKVEAVVVEHSEGMPVEAAAEAPAQESPKKAAPKKAAKKEEGGEA